MIEFINLSSNIINVINNLYFFFVNYKAMHKLFAHKNYMQFHNDEIKNEKIENKMYFINCRYQDNKSNFCD